MWGEKGPGCTVEFIYAVRAPSRLRRRILHYQRAHDRWSMHEILGMLRSTCGFTPITSRGSNDPSNNFPELINAGSSNCSLSYKLFFLMDQWIDPTENNWSGSEHNTAIIDPLMRVWVASLLFYIFVFAVCEILRYVIHRWLASYLPRLLTGLLLEVLSLLFLHILLVKKFKFQDSSWINLKS